MVNYTKLLKSKLKNYLLRALSIEPKSLTKVYVLALSSIAAMTFIFQGFKSTIHSDQLKAVNAIRSIDKQAGKAENIYGKIIDAQITVNANKRSKKIKDVEREIRELTRNHKVLIVYANGGFHCQKNRCKDFLGNEPFADFYNTNLETVKTNDLVEKLELLLDSLKEYRKFLANAGNFFEKKAKANTKEIIYLDRLFCVLLVILLLFQAIFIFRPVVRKLQEALAARSDFISRISHEIRNPMNSILGMADILKSTKLTSEQAQYLGNLQRSGIVLLDMLNNLVDFSSLEKSKINIKTSTFSILKMIDKTTSVVAVQSHDKGVELFINIDPKIPKKVQGDVSRLEQVLINLLNNALKFTNKGYIKLSLERVEGLNNSDVYVKFSVKDTGIGIDKTKIKLIFESFVQEDSSIKRRFGGSGLGLSICKEIVELMGSHLEVTSEKGVGSNFNFSVNLGKELDESVTHRSDKEIIFLSGLSHEDPIRNYMNNSFKKFSICNKIEDLENLVLELKNPCELIVDDSVGIINMINAVSVTKENSLVTSTFALIRSNFPKENMDLIRRNGYKKFLIKPFRHWHLIGEENDLESYIESNSGRVSKNISAKNLKILAVDDANDNLFLIREILTPLTKDIDFAINGLEAINQMKKKKYDVVFMDIQMPVMDGYTAIRKIRQSNKKTPVFAVTAHAGLVEERKCLDAGFTARLTKPIDRKKIYDAIMTEFKISTTEVEIPELTVEEKIIKRLLPEYFKTREEDLKLLKSALEKNDHIMIKKIGHKIKGSAKSYGFDFVGILSGQLEEAADGGDMTLCKELASKIEEVLAIAKNKSLSPASNSDSRV